MKRVIRILSLAGAVAAVYMWLKRSNEARSPISRRHPLSESLPQPDKESRSERRSAPDPAALAADSQDAVALDLDRLVELKSSSHQPLAEYLTAIRIKRGSEESLLFVRRRDVEELASLVGSTEEEFLENFRQLGVVVSLN
jgi:hypothetical protein